MGNYYNQCRCRFDIADHYCNYHVSKTKCVTRKIITTALIRTTTQVPFVQKALGSFEITSANQVYDFQTII